MYAGGHLLTSALAGTKLWNKTSLSFSTTVAILLGTNAIDFDHLLRFQLDDGTANSLTLHWLHINSPVIFLGIFMVAFWIPKARDWALVMGFGLALHFSMDALAYTFNYNMLILGMTDLMLFVLLSRTTLRSSIPANKTKLLLFYATSWIFMTGTQALIHFIGQFKPQEHIWVYVVSPAMLLISAIMFWTMFASKKANKTQTITE